MEKVVYSFLAVCLLIFLSACEEKYDMPEFPSESLKPNLTIAEMQALYDGEHPLTFSENYRIGGTVTTSDASGNFYRTFFVEDETGAVEIMAGLYDLHTLYPAGRKICIDLRGLTLARTDAGIFQLGFKAVPSSGYAVDYIGHTALLDKYVTRGEVNNDFYPLDVWIPDLDDVLLGRLVTLHNLVLRGGGEATWATVQGHYPKDIRATDPYGDWLYVYTSGYADFAGETIPYGLVSITGILMKNGKRYRLKMRDLRDVIVY